MSKIIPLLALVTALGLSPAARVDATPMLRLTSGGSSVTITDELPGDDSVGIAGAISYSGAVGTFHVVSTLGVTKPFVGLADDSPSVNLLVEARSSGAGTLVIALTETGFTGPTPTAEFVSELAGTATAADTMVRLQVYRDNSNTALGLDALIADTTGVTVGADLGFSEDASSGSVALQPPYSLTVVATIHHVGIEPFTSLAATLGVAQVPVPEASTLVLVGMGLASLGVVRKMARLL